MGQERISKEEAGEILYKRFHMDTAAQKILHSTRNFVRLVGDYLGIDRPLIQAMVTWPCHIDGFDKHSDKAFSGKRLFGENIVNRIHKRFHVFLDSCNMMSLDGVKTSALLESREIQRMVERGKWGIPPPHLTG